jgi:4-hydroxy-3-methylbut-2-enyl diphosphate reductase
VIESINDLSKLNFSRPIYLFSQTTKSVEEFEDIVAEIKKRRMELVMSESVIGSQEIVFEYHNTICRNVANRVKRLQDFARSNDVVIFVGGKKSSNAKVLFNNCLEVNRSTIFVSSTDDITYEIVQQCRQAEYVGICGATSTPKWLMEEIRKCIVESV